MPNIRTGPPGFIPDHVALAVDDPHLAGAVDHPVFHVVARPTGQRRRRGRRRSRPVLRVDQGLPALVPDRQIDDAVFRLQAKDPGAFVRERDVPSVEVAVPVADVCDPLRLFQPPLALAQAAEDQDAGEGVREPPASLLEEPLLRRRPDARTRALVQPEQVGLPELRGRRPCRS